MLLLCCHSINSKFSDPPALLFSMMSYSKFADPSHVPSTREPPVLFGSKRPRLCDQLKENFVKRKPFPTGYPRSVHSHYSTQGYSSPTAMPPRMLTGNSGRTANSIRSTNIDETILRKNFMVLKEEPHWEGDVAEMTPEGEYQSVGAEETCIEEDTNEVIMNEAEILRESSISSRLAQSADMVELGSYLTLNKNNFETSSQMIDHLCKLRLGPVDLDHMIQWCSDAKDKEEERTRFMVTGVAAMVTRQAFEMERASARFVRLERAFAKSKTTSDNDEAKKFTSAFVFMSVSVGTGSSDGAWQDKYSVDTELFHKGILFRQILQLVQVKLAKENKNSKRPAKNQSDWEEFVQNVYYAMLRDKSNIRRLTYRSSQPTQKDDKVLLNVCDSKRCDYECTDKLIDFILNAVSRKGVPEEVQWCSRIASTITQALAKARRRYDEARARREREPLLDLSEFDRTLKPSGNPLMVSCKDQPKVVPPVSEEN